MPSESKDSALDAIHASHWGLVIAATGGGSGALADLLQTPGASRTVLEAVVPYSLPALEQFLGARPEHACSAATARAMAAVALHRARTLAAAEANAAQLAGVGCTASLATDRPKKGAHRIHIATQTIDATRISSIDLAKGTRSRREEEAIAANAMLRVIAETVELDAATAFPLELTTADRCDQTAVTAPPDWRELFLGSALAVPSRGGARTIAPGKAIFPGAFNPRHVGHRRMADIARQRLSRPVEHEASILNVDKPPLDYWDMDARARQFADDEPLWFTRAPTFVEKGAIFPRATFIVGADTIVRIADPKYYGGSRDQCDRAIASLAAAEARFLVFDRQIGGDFRPLRELPLPAALQALCQEVPPEEFREDISSTDLRQRQPEA